MIIEAILDILITLVLAICDFIADQLGAPFSGQFKIPRPLYFMSTVVLSSMTASYVVAFVWFIWVQVWGKPGSSGGS